MGNASGAPSRPKSLTEFLERYKGKLMAPYNQRGLTEGICHGMCLDWIRGMLHQKVESFKVLAKLNTEGFSAIVLVQEEMHKLFKGGLGEYQEKMQQEVDAQKIRLRTLADREIDLKLRSNREVQAYKSMAAATRLVAQSGYLDPASEANMNLAVQAAAQSTQQRLAVYRPQIRQLGAAYEKLSADLKPKMAKLREIASDFLVTYPHLYQQFKASYKERFKERDHFDDIQLAHSVPGGSPEDLAKWMANIRTCIQKLGAGHAALLNFRRPGGGHFVAFYRDGERYHFFDPNAGWYGVSSAEEAGQLFEDLFSAVYAAKRYDTSEWRLFLRG